MCADVPATITLARLLSLTFAFWCALNLLYALLVLILSFLVAPLSSLMPVLAADFYDGLNSASVHG